MTEPALGRWPVSLEIPVAWGEMDAFGHVNNTVFLRWFENGRIAYFEHLGGLDRMERDGIGPILARVTCDFHRAVTYPDRIRAEVTVTRLGRTSLVMAYRVHSEQQDALVAEGDSVIVMFDYRTDRKVELGPELRADIEALEKQGEG